MSFNLNTVQIRDDLTQLLKDNLANINQNVVNKISAENKIVNTIYTGFPFNSIDLPQICVYQISKDNEEFTGISAIGRHNTQITFEIVGIVRVVKASKVDVGLSNDVMYMANNIDEILRNNINFSSQILTSIPQNYELIVNDTQTGIYVCMFKTQLICNCDVIKCNS